MLQPSGPDELKRPESVRILLLEDERTCAEIVGENLRRIAGAASSLDTVGTLAEALARLGRGAFDLIVADLNLPDSRGLETLGALTRATDRLIIVLTGDDDASLQQGAMALGAYDFVHKRQLASGALERVVRLASMQANTFRSLRESEARFRKLTELSSDWYWEQDSEFRLTFMSKLVGELAGLDPQAYLGRRRWDQPALNLGEADWARHRAQLERHEPFRDFEMQRLSTDDRTVWLSVSGEPVFDAAGRFKGYRGIGRDITADKRADQAVRESEARFRSLVELSTDFYWESDAEHRLTRTTHDQKHRPASQPVIGKTRWELPSIYPDAAGWAAHRAVLAARRPFVDFEMGRIDPDGVRRYLSVSGEPVYGAHGEFLGYRGVGRDISERKEREGALQRFRTALDSSADMVFLFRLRDGSLLDFNQSACKYLGYSRDELLALRAVDIRTDVTPEALHSEVAELIETPGRTNTVLTEYRRKDGSTFPVESRRNILDTPRGRVLVVNSTDLSERRSAEKRRAAQTRYQKKIARLGQTALAKRDAAGLIEQAVRSVLEGLGGGAVAYVERGAGEREIVLRRAAGLAEPATEAGVATGRAATQARPSSPCPVTAAHGARCAHCRNSPAPSGPKNRASSAPRPACCPRRCTGSTARRALPTSPSSTR